MNNTDIPPDVLDTTVDDYFIKVIANKYLISWEELGPVLGFTYAQEKAISRSFPNDYGQQKHSFLYQWKDLNGDGATYRVLINAAEAEEHRNLADNIRKLLRERFRISSPPSLAVRPALSAPLVCCCFESIAYLHHQLFPAASSSHPYPPLDPLYIAGKRGSQPYPIISRKLKKRRSYHIPPHPPSALNHNCLCTTQTLSWPTKNILQKLSHLEDKFVMVLTNAQYCFGNMTPEYTDRFKILLINLPISTRFEHLTFLTVESQGISSARNMMEIFQMLKNHWNPFDIGLLEHLVDVFGTGDLKQDVDNYKNNLEAFEKNTTVQQFQDAWKKSIHAPDHYGRIVKIMKADPLRCTLWKVRCFKENLRKRATLQNYVGAVTRLAVSSVIITFALPRSGILLVKNNIDAEFWADQNLESVTIDGEQVFPKNGNRASMSHSDVLSTSGPSKSMGVFSNLLALQLVTKEEGESLTKSYIFSYDLFQSEVVAVSFQNYVPFGRGKNAYEPHGVEITFSGTGGQELLQSILKACQPDSALKLYGIGEKEILDERATPEDEQPSEGDVQVELYEEVSGETMVVPRGRGTNRCCVLL